MGFAFGLVNVSWCSMPIRQPVFISLRLSLTPGHIFMTSKTCTMATAALVLLFLSSAFASGQTVAKDGKIPWSLTVVVMDGVDQRSKAEVPVSEAVSFIE